MIRLMPTTSAQTRRKRRGFTLVEILIASLLLALLASLTISRVMGTTKRVFDHTVESVADLLIVFAQRNQFSRNPIALRWDEGGKQGTLRVVSLNRNEDLDDVLPVWEIEPNFPSVIFPEPQVARLVSVKADGEMAEIAEYPLPIGANMPRPSIEIRLEDPNGQIHTVSLAAHEISPNITETSEAGMSKRLPIDLNETGQRWEEW